MKVQIRSCLTDEEFCRLVQAELTGALSSTELLQLAAACRMCPATRPIVELGTGTGQALAALCYGSGNDKRVFSVNNWRAWSKLEAWLPTLKRKLLQIGPVPTILACEFNEVPATLQSPGLLFLDWDAYIDCFISELPDWLKLLCPKGLLCIVGPRSTSTSYVLFVRELNNSGWHGVGTDGRITLYRR